ncbi:MAG: M18 family aminopeptidase [Ruminococcaceae bacterium]|jgi:aspartyl aminopeptidase|nr:M18 family aminopeptidase [Oscillospiraceae bacterium]
MITTLLRDLKNSPTAFHAVDTVRRRLLEVGYAPLGRDDALATGGKYFITPHSSSLIAFRLPTQRPIGFIISASHADSPCFHLRDHAELTGGDFVRLSAERYGGMIHDSWLDRPLSIAGRVMVRTADGVRQQLVDLQRDAVLIPRLAIHLNRSVNEGYKYDPAKDLIPLYGAASSAGSLRRELAARLGCAGEDILSTDLIIYNNQDGTVWGPADEFLSAPRLDDLACVFTCTEAFLQAADSLSVPVLCVFDNEEIGSETKQGAAAVTLPETLAVIAAALGEDLGRLLENSLLLSCDNGHGRHPNHPELADASEAPVLGGGVVIKHSPRYATDAMSAALFSEICRRAGVPVQHYANRPDQAGGATLGNIASTRTPISTVDIGMAQLAMHSCFETLATADVTYFLKAVTACYESALRADGDTVQIL